MTAANHSSSIPADEQPATGSPLASVSTDENDRHADAVSAALAPASANDGALPSTDGLNDGLPRTGERASKWLVAGGMLLLAITSGAEVWLRKRRN
ncbi:LPXTG cell wall anchor domain-containing protein [Lactiplantibacillus garii]|uniref:LPXTG cell wall anchor domain-containing protein n=1 Tax=Lactiplantibacillus garii TaxID=2306423 RepID=UPI001CDD4E96|nr:LPXTG cell wall anchor domain-containing protein [Lactiplantibacillus garii]